MVLQVHLHCWLAGRHWGHPTRGEGAHSTQPYKAGSRNAAAAWALPQPVSVAAAAARFGPRRSGVEQADRRTGSIHV
jgi:hypothetical protein